MPTPRRPGLDPGLGCSFGRGVLSEPQERSWTPDQVRGDEYCWPMLAAASINAAFLHRANMA